MSKLNEEESRKVVNSISSMLDKSDFGRMDDLKKFFNVINESKCKQCNDNGIINATSTKNEFKYVASYIFKCTCESGKNRKEAWPEWNFDINYKKLS